MLLEKKNFEIGPLEAEILQKTWKYEIWRTKIGFSPAFGVISIKWPSWDLQLISLGVNIYPWRIEVTSLRVYMTFLKSQVTSPRPQGTYLRPPPTSSGPMSSLMAQCHLPGALSYRVISPRCRIKLSFFSAMGSHRKLQIGLYWR